MKEQEYKCLQCGWQGLEKEMLTHICPDRKV